MPKLYQSPGLGSLSESHCRLTMRSGVNRHDDSAASAAAASRAAVRPLKIASLDCLKLNVGTIQLTW